MKWFNNPETLEDLKKQYKKLDFKIILTGAAKLRICRRLTLSMKRCSPG